MVNKFKFKLNCDAPCNAEYVRAQGGVVGQASFTDEQLTRYAEYIKHVVSQQSEDRPVDVNIYGGDLYSLLPQLSVFTAALGDATTNTVFLNLESVYFRQNLQNILSFIGNSPCRVVINLYASMLDDASSDEQAAINYSAMQGLCRYAFVWLTPENIYRLPEIFDNWKRLHEKFPRFACELRIDTASFMNASLDEEMVRFSAETVANAIGDNEALKKEFVYSPVPALRTAKVGNALMGDVLGVMCDDGVVYPGYDEYLMSDKAREELALGNIADDFSVLDAGRKALYDQLEVSGGGLAGDCTDMTRSVPWNDPDYEYSMKATEQLCMLHNVLAEALPYRMNLHTTDNAD